MAEMLKGFGRRQTYESLTCRNPRGAWRGLWGFRILVGQALCTNGCQTGYADGEGSALTVDSTVPPGASIPDLGHRNVAADAHSERDRWPKPGCFGV